MTGDSIRIGIWGAVLFSTAACAGGDAPAPDADVPTFEGVVELEIGELEGEDAYLFSRIASVAADSRGRILVADRGVSEVRVFDPDGLFLFRFGGEGDGPEEFRNPCCLGFSPEGHLWVRQEARYTAFELGDAAATYLRVQRRLFGGQGGAAPVTFDAEGRLVDIGSLPNPGDAFAYGRVHVNADGSADTVELREPGSRGGRTPDRGRRYERVRGRLQAAAPSCTSISRSGPCGGTRTDPGAHGPAPRVPPTRSNFTAPMVP